MMKKTIILFVTFFISQVCFGQKGFVSDSIVEKRVDSLANVIKFLWEKDLDSASVMAKYMLNYSIENDNIKSIAKSYATVAGVSNMSGKIGESIAYYIKAAKIFNDLNDQRYVAIMNYNIGVGLFDLSRFQEAEIYIKKAHNYFLITDQDDESKLIYMALGDIGIKTNKSFDYTMLKLKKAEELTIEKKDTLTLSNVLNLQGEAYIVYEKGFEIAVLRLKKSLNLIKDKDFDNHFTLGYSHFLLGKAYWKMRDYDKALLHNDSSLVHYKQLNYFKGLMLAYKNKKAILKSTENYKESDIAYDSFIQYKDSMFKKEQTNQLARIKTEYETEQITAQKETAETKLKLTETISQQNRSYFIGTLIIGFFMLMTAIFYFKRLRANKKIEFLKLEFNENEKRLKLEKQLVASKLESLQSQMNPHFTFNALNSIQNLVLKDRKYEAYDYLNRFSSLLRENLNMSKKSYVFFDDELQLLTKYLELEQLRFRENFEYEIKGDDKVGEIKIPTMIIQPYIENAIKHGLLHKINGTKKISITFIQDDVLTCIVEDNGVGIEASQKIQERNGVKKDSFSTSAIKDKMSFLRDHYKTDIGVVYEDVQQGTKVIIKMPYKDF